MEQGINFDPCPEDNPCCPLYPNCYADIDHTFGPKSQYRTTLEREFRNLPQNKTFRCRDRHNTRHATESFPNKPSHDEMLRAIGKLGIDRIGDCR